jgi:UDP-N-acetylmuramoyl-tripeptide--D-alanyl-D-alanine ligase
MDSGNEAQLVSHEPESEGMRLKANIFGVRVDTRVGAPGGHIAANAVAALGAVALMGGDVLNAASVLRNFTALPGRGARFEAHGVLVIDESYNANPASMAAALLLLKSAPGRRIAVLGDMLEMGPGGPEHHAGLAKPLADADVDLVFASGALMRSLWDVLPSERRGAWAQSADELKTRVLAALAPGDTVLIKGSNGSRMSRIVEALKV